LAFATTQPAQATKIFCMNLIRGFTEHPASVGESYGEHLMHAMCFGTRMMLAGVACMVHALLPFMFERTGSRTVSALHERMLVHRGRVLNGIAAEKPLSL
jgi:hypothetical protein